MPNVGVLIVFAVLGAFVCAKGRHAGGAVVFSLLGLVMFVSTPVGSGLPGAVASFLSAVNDSTTPALTQTTSEQGSSPSAGAHTVRVDR